jgi:hypothetical protein
VDQTGERKSTVSVGRKVIWGLIVAQVILVVVVVLGWRGRAGSASSPLVRLETGVTAGTPLTIESGLAGALGRAREWSQDAFLFAAGMQIDWPTDPATASGSELPGNGWVLYTFASEKVGVGPGGEAATLSMMVDRMSGVLIDERELGWTELPRRRADLATYPISSSVALFAIETTDGNRYRNSCPEFRHLARVSIVPSLDGGDADWLVTYEDQRSGGRPAILVRVDAVTGQVEREEPVDGADATC